MTVEISRLANGLTVATDPMPQIMSACIGVWVECGARYETQAQMGLSHMLEHMAFKGTKTRSAKQISEEIESVGGELNAYTGREQTAYYVRLLKEDVPLGLDLLSDILLHPAFAPDEIERERGVILQELGQSKDTPDDILFDHLQSVCYPGQPMGWPVLGNEKTVGGFQAGDLIGYMGTHYHAPNMMLIGAGAIEHRQLVEAGERLFGALGRKDAPEALPAHFVGGEKRDVQNLEQAHIAWAFPGVAISDPDAITAQIYATALGGGTSSRLFQEAREKRGLCYSISAFAAPHRDSGIIGIYTGTSERDLAKLAPIVAAEMEDVAAHATEEETARARAQLKASLLMGLESPFARAEQAASHLSAFGRVLTTEELIARLNAVDASALRRFATRVMESASPAIAAVGPVKKLESHASFAARFGKAHDKKAGAGVI